MRLKDLKIQAQPNDFTCGPTCLQSIYNFYGEDIELDQVIQEVQTLANYGGTLSVQLANHALQKGYKATIFNYNLTVFDPTWFPYKSSLHLIDKLKEQIVFKKEPKLINASNAYIKFLELGGTIKFRDLNEHLLETLFKQNIPILTGLSATYLYQSSREFSMPNGDLNYDDVKGEPTGHFVVLCGYNNNKQYILVADPFKANPVSRSNYYSANSRRLINSILLGIITYDANLLIIEPKTI
jgi:hypothetical protein